MNIRDINGTKWYLIDENMWWDEWRNRLFPPGIYTAKEIRVHGKPSVFAGWGNIFVTNNINPIEFERVMLKLYLEGKLLECQI